MHLAVTQGQGRPDLSNVAVAVVRQSWGVRTRDRKEGKCLRKNTLYECQTIFDPIRGIG